VEIMLGSITNAGIITEGLILLVRLHIIFVTHQACKETWNSLPLRNVRPDENDNDANSDQVEVDVELELEVEPVEVEPIQQAIERDKESVGTRAV